MSDCCSVPGLMPFEEALDKLLSGVSPVTETLLVPIQEALNYVIASDVISPIDVPGHDNSAMDGYAFAHQSLILNKTLTLVGKSMAGEPFTGQCREGECIRIMTGAKMPDDCDTVEMQENTQTLPSNNNSDSVQICFSQEKKRSAHVRNKGEDIKQGQTILKQGQRITAIDMGSLASLGIENVSVYRKLRVALIATGDELKLPGQKLHSGDIYETNSFVLSSLLAKLHVEVINFGIIKDDFNAIKEAFTLADMQADAVISSGGVSVGDADYTKGVLEELGEISFWQIAMKPGKPFAFGQLPHSVFFGLPGNPVSALVTFHQLALIALVKMQNAKPLQRIKMPAKLLGDLKKSPGRMDFQRGFFTLNDKGEPCVQSTGSQGSGILSSLALANCFIILPAASGSIAAGEKVTIELFDHFLGGV